MVDFYDLFSPDARADTSPASIEIARLNEQPKIVVAFTPECHEVGTHYNDTGETRGHVQCNADSTGKCLLCDIGHKLDKRIILPVYDVESNAVVALLIPTTISPSSLAPQIRREMERGDLHKRYLFITWTYNKYVVKSGPIPEAANAGEAEIAHFLNQVEEGRLSLKDVIPSLPNAELYEIPQNERKATALGKLKQDYIVPPEAASNA